MELGHNLGGALKSFLALASIDQVDEDEKIHVEINLDEDDWGQPVGLKPLFRWIMGTRRDAYLWLEGSETGLAARQSQR